MLQLSRGVGVLLSGQQGGGGGGPLPLQLLALLTTPGAGVFVTPAGVRMLVVEFVGGGGGGGGAEAASAVQASAGGGGGGGGFLQLLYGATAGFPWNYEVGAAGVGGVAGADGTQGGGTWWDIPSNFVSGGTGGERGQVAFTGTRGGSGGAPAGIFLGTIATRGEAGQNGFVSSGLRPYGGNGGGSIYQGGGKGAFTLVGTQSGQAGYFFGAGGGGATCQNGAAATGGNGATGAIAIWGLA